MGETLKEAVLRETKEEKGLEVELLAYLNAYIGRLNSGDLIARHVWLAKPINKQQPSPMIAGEIAECLYVSKNEFETLYKNRSIRMHHIKLMFEDALRVT